MLAEKFRMGAMDTQQQWLMTSWLSLVATGIKCLSTTYTFIDLKRMS
jgi:hypothetical protein